METKPNDEEEQSNSSMRRWNSRRCCDVWQRNYYYYHYYYYWLFCIFCYSVCEQQASSSSSFQYSQHPPQHSLRHVLAGGRGQSSSTNVSGGIISAVASTNSDGGYQGSEKNTNKKKEEYESSYGGGVDFEEKRRREFPSTSPFSTTAVTRCMTAAATNQQQITQQADAEERQEEQQVLGQPCPSSTTTVTITTTNNSTRDSFIVWSPQEENQSRSDAEHELYNYLYENLMPFDVPNAQSLGFHSGDDYLPDGLSDGIVAHAISISLDARQQYPWTFHVPKNIYFEYVGGFANVNEARNNWRPLFKQVMDDILQPLWLKQRHQRYNEISVEDVVREINQNLWDKFYTRKPIYFESGQTPLIYDPMSIIAYGYASCTGLSIFLIDALRTAGIPARLAGTPAWNGKKENGNHSWVEFYGSESQWHIMEAKPASGGGGEDIDLWDPCQWWFCNEGRTENTNFFAARLNRSCDGSFDGVVFPLAWDSKNDGVVGEDRTDFMRDLCSQCK